MHIRVSEIITYVEWIFSCACTHLSQAVGLPGEQGAVQGAVGNAAHGLIHARQGLCPHAPRGKRLQQHHIQMHLVVHTKQKGERELSSTAFRCTWWYKESRRAKGPPPKPRSDAPGGTKGTERCEPVTIKGPSRTS